MPSAPKIDRQKASRIVCTFVCTPEEVTQAQDKVLRQFAQSIEVQGFRKGHAPIEKVRERIRPEAMDEEVIRTIVSGLLPSLVGEHGLKPVIAPSVGVTSRDPLTLQVTVIERPVAKVKHQKKLAIPKKKIEADATQVDKVIVSVLGEQRTATPVDRPIKNDDRITADFTAVDKEHKNIPGLDAKGYTILVGSESLLPGFEKQLLGMEKGKSKTFTLTLPEKFPAEHLRNTPVTFTVTVHTVEETKVPELTDAYAKEQLQSESAAAFRTMVENSLKMQDEQMDHMERERKLMDAIHECTEVDLPEELVQEELKRLVDEWGHDLEKQGTTIADAIKKQGKKVEEVEQDLKKRAADRWKLRLGMSALIEEKKIEATDAEIAEAFAQYSERLPENERASATAAFDAHEDMYEEVRWRLLVQKVIDLLLDEQ